MESACHNRRGTWGLRARAKETGWDRGDERHVLPTRRTGYRPAGEGPWWEGQVAGAKEGRG